MKRKKFSIFMVFVSILLIAVNAYAGEKKNIYLMIDLSDSPLHITSQVFAEKIATYVDENVLSNLALGSTIEILSFGEYELTKNLLSFDFIILKKPGYRKNEVRGTVKLLLYNLPGLIRKGKFKLQKETGLIGALKILSQRLDKSQDNVIVIISDMLEFSPDANCYQLVVQKNGTLPKAQDNLLGGAKVIALGAGYGVKNSTQNDRLQGLWKRLFKQSGAKEFVYLSIF